MVQLNLKGYVAGSILIQTDHGEGCQIEMKESCVCGRVQMKLGAVSRHLVRGMGWVATDDCEECLRGLPRAGRGGCCKDGTSTDLTQQPLNCCA